MTYTCKECSAKFLSRKEYDNHVNTHLQTHIDFFQAKIPDSKTPWESFSNIPEGMEGNLLKVFEKYNLGDKSMLCLWRNGYLSCALRGRSREQELQTRLKDWLQE
jgi:hypothetical protein